MNLPIHIQARRTRTSWSALGVVVAALCVATAHHAHAQWTPEGVSLCQDHCGDLPRMASDGLGGAFVAWRRSVQGSGDVYLQRVTTEGLIAPGWPPELPVCTDPASQQSHVLASDGSGGVYVAWEDYRNPFTGGSGADIYAQRILADGNLAPGWVVDGVPVTQAPGTQRRPVMITDGAGGAYLSWDDSTVPDIYLQRMGAGGQPTPGWPGNGVPVCVQPAGQGAAQLAPDGAGGVIIAWGDLRDSTVAVYAQRVTSTGQALWAENGVRLVLGRAIRPIVSDAAGGAFVLSAMVGQSYDTAYYLQRVSGTGATAPGWPVDGVPVCTATEERASALMVPDGGGGVLIVWIDFRDNLAGEIYLQRVRADGTLPSGWPVDGLRLSSDSAFDGDARLAPDGLGGAYVCWSRILAPFGSSRIVVQHVTDAGVIAPGWPATGLEIPGTTGQGIPSMIADGAGGAIVAWHTIYDVLAQRFGVDGPVSVQLALASAEAEPDRVVLLWQGPGAGTLEAQVERRTERTEWQRLGPATAEGNDRLRFEDRSVAQGERYAYRLAYTADGLEHLTAETWVEVPPALELALEGFRPNPVVGAATVAFTLTDARSARLEVLDVSGRRVLARELSSLGPGRHMLRISDHAQLAPGVYLLRLTSGDRVLIARGVVMR